MDMVTQGQILDQPAFILYSANILEMDMTPIILSPSMDK